MDINDLRIIVMLVSFAVFIAILWWAFSSKNKQSFDEAALLPFTEDGPIEAGHQAQQVKAVNAEKSKKEAS